MSSNLIPRTLLFLILLFPIHFKGEVKIPVEYKTDNLWERVSPDLILEDSSGILAIGNGQYVLYWQDGCKYKIEVWKVLNK